MMLGQDWRLGPLAPACCWDTVELRDARAVLGPSLWRLEWWWGRPRSRVCQAGLKPRICLYTMACLMSIHEYRQSGAMVSCPVLAFPGLGSTLGSEAKSRQSSSLLIVLLGIMGRATGVIQNCPSCPVWYTATLIPRFRNLTWLSY